MDDRRFDQLTRMVGRGASRRAMLKALLGLGSSAIAATVAAEEVDAREIGSRPSGGILGPPPPPTTTTTTTTAAPCPAGEVQCPSSTVCCPTGTCARAGNQAICCDGTLGNGSIVCGLDCCEDELQCCDGECCPDGAICLARRFPESPGVEEETCCPVESICTGTGPFAGQGACCFGETPDCCIRENGEPVCINPETQCCNDEECPDNPRSCDIGVCLRGSQTCDTDFICGDDQHCCGAQGDEEAGTCVDADQCCTSVECDDDFANCQIGVCNREVFRCEAVSACELGSDCCAVNDSGACAPVEERTPCALEEGGTGICCTGECADTSLCVCTRNVECDPDRCEECLDDRCLSRCGVLLETLDTPVCDGAGTCVECLVDDDCFGGFCNPVTNTCFECRSNEDCFDCRICDVATQSCVPDLEANGESCFEFEDPDLTCCFGDCLRTCQTCASDADCPSCEICDVSSGTGQGHCQPCFFNNSGCCFDDFCLPFDSFPFVSDCCRDDSDCPPPECSFDHGSIVRYACVTVTASGGICQPMIPEVCEGCTSCLDDGAGPQCVEGCQPGRACCVADVCQRLRTCPFSCIEDTDCPGVCAFCQENGFCGTLDDCVPTTTTPAPATTTTTSTTTQAPATTTTEAPGTTTTAQATLGAGEASTLVQDCVPAGCADLGLSCGGAGDGCGGWLDCGPCPTTAAPAPAAPMTCLTEGERCVNDSQCCAGLCRGRGCRDRGTKLCQAACST